MIQRRTMLVLAGLTCGVSATLAGQSDTYAPVILQLSPSARSAVLGDNPGVRDIDAFFANPALAGQVPGTMASFGRFDAATLLTLASSQSLGTYNVAVGASYLAAHSDVVRVPFWSHSMIRGGPVPVASVLGTVAFSTTFRGNRVGAAARFVDERIGSDQDAVPSLDVGLARDAGRITTGVAVQNIGRGLQHGGTPTQLPLRVAVGASTYGYALGPFDAGGAAGVAVLPNGNIYPSFALEMGYVPLDGYLFQARVGMRRPELQARQSLSLGVTASLDRFTVDYSFEDWAGGGAHRLALRLR